MKHIEVDIDSCRSISMSGPLIVNIYIWAKEPKRSYPYTLLGCFKRVILRSANLWSSASFLQEALVVAKKGGP